MEKRPKVMSGGDAHKYLHVSRQRFEYLVKSYDIPYQQTSAGKIYFLEDLKEFQNYRKSSMKHAAKKKKKGE